MQGGGYGDDDEDDDDEDDDEGAGQYYDVDEEDDEEDEEEDVSYDIKFALDLLRIVNVLSDKAQQLCSKLNLQLMITFQTASTRGSVFVVVTLHCKFSIEHHFLAFAIEGIDRYESCH